MIAMRLARAVGKKSLAAAKKHAAAAVKVAPTPMSYLALGTALSRPAADMMKLRAEPRGRAVDALRKALELNEAEKERGSRATALSRDREAEAHVQLANLLTTQTKPPPTSVEEAQRLMRKAEAMAPRNPRYKDARQQLEQGVERYQQGLQQANLELAKQRQRDLEAEEEAEAEADEFSEQW